MNVQVYADTGMVYDGRRVLNNLSGHCPAEPTSLAVAAAHHTLTKLLLFLVQYVKVGMHHLDMRTHTLLRLPLHHQSIHHSHVL